MNARRSAAAAIAAGAVIALLAGCSGSGGNTATTAAADGGNQTVHFSGSDLPSAYTKVIADFEKLHPNIKVEYTQIPFASYNPTLQQRLAANNNVDVYLVEQVNAIQYAAQGYMTDESAIAGKVKQVISSQVFDSGVYKDKLYAVPLYTSMQIMFYNKKLLAKAGIADPSSDPSKRLTWQQVTAGAAALKKAGAKYTLGIEQPTTYYQLQPIVESAGGGPGIGGKNGLSVDITNPKWNETLQWYGDNYSSGISPRVTGFGQVDQLFASGSLAYDVAGPWVLGQFKASSVDWGYAPMPMWQGGTPKTPAIGWSIAVNPKSPVLSAAQQFMQYAALDKDGNASMGIGSGSITYNSQGRPATLASVEAAGGPHAVGTAKLIDDELDNTASLPPTSVGFPQFQTEVNLAIGDILNGAAAAPRLAKAQQTIQTQWKSLLG